MLHSLPFDTYYMYLLSDTKNENNWPQIIDAVVVWIQQIFTRLKSYNLPHPHSY